MKTQNPWMGRARGSAGNMTSSKVYDKNVMRAKAFEVNNPKTAAQTNERNFFAQCQDLSNQFSEEQLRTLFGIKPKNKSRRNALLSQILKAYTFSEGNKIFYPSALQSIGNGPKVNTPFLDTVGTNETIEIELNPSMLNISPNDYAELYFVGYEDNTSKFYIIDCVMSGQDLGDYDTLAGYGIPEGLWCGYFTTNTENKDTEVWPFGTFALKTRAV